MGQPGPRQSLPPASCPPSSFRLDAANMAQRARCPRPARPPPPSQISFHGPRCEFVCEHTVRVAKDANVGSALRELRPRLPEPASAAPLRLMLVRSARLYRLVDEDESVECLDDGYWQVSGKGVSSPPA
eukprot:345220-Chlamydomonas_euryale.AAC.1